MKVQIPFRPMLVESLRNYSAPAFSRDLIAGLTVGIAVLIFSTQIKDFFGLAVGAAPADFVEKIRVLAEHFGTLQWPTLSLGLASLLIIVWWPKKLARRIPGSMVALVFGTALVMLF